VTPEGMAEPTLLKGRLSVDDRGTVAFVNDFDLAPVRRFYVVTNHRRGFIRAWHAHRNERKFVTLLQGSALVCCVRIDDWDRPSPELPVSRYVLSAVEPSVLEVPAGYANGFMSLSDDAAVLFFSSSTLAESQGDDVRYPARHWDPWQIEER
jgi:dTDP-4-dehydrorhamnose 3,5-epimerase-like enzyme